MTFASWPLAAIAAAIAIPALVALYFLKLKRRDVEVSTTLLWRQTIRDMQANAPFQKLRRNLLLLLQLLALAAALFAIATPRMARDAAPPDRTVILIDRSASMGARTAPDPAAPTRLDLAKRDAVAFVNDLAASPAVSLFSPSDPPQAMVIAFGADAQVIQPFTASRDALIDAIESIEPSLAPARLTEAVRLAAPFTTPRIADDESVIPGATLAIWSDGSISDLDRAQIHPQTNIRFVAPPADPAPNLAITAIDARRTLDRLDRLSLFVAVQSNDPEPRRTDVELAIDDEVVALRNVELPGAAPDAPAISGVVFTLTRTSAAIARIRLLHPPGADDRFDQDDQGVLVIQPARRLAIAHIVDGPSFVDDALAGVPLARFDRLTPDDYRRRATAAELDAYDVIILERWVPAPDDPPLPPGNYLTYAVVPPIDSIQPSDDAPPERILTAIDWDRRHPATAPTDLTPLRVAEVLPVTLADSARVLARSAVAPLIVTAEDARHRVIAVLFDPMKSNWPFDVSFVLFNAAATRALADDTPDPDARILNPGDVARIRLPAAATDPTLTTPSGRTLELTPDDAATVTLAPIAEVGLYTLEWTGPPGPRDATAGGRALRPIAAAILDPEESALAVTETLTLPFAEIPAITTQTEPDTAARELAPWFLAAALALVLAEWWLYNRRTIA